ncbi:unnamed protein product, partial [Rotaria sp. Silwood1]
MCRMCRDLRYNARHEVL